MTDARRTWVGFFCGLLFGVGLVVSGMTDPNKVIGFLDVTHDWDASLLFVMVGAVGVHLPLYRLYRRRRGPLVTASLAAAQGIDARLVAGAAVFGLGWGVAGYCPGPAVVALGGGSAAAAVFVLAMLAGIWLERRLSGLSSRELRPALDQRAPAP